MVKLVKPVPPSGKTNFFFAMTWRRGESEKRVRAENATKPRMSKSITFILVVEKPYHDPGKRNARTGKTEPGFVTLRWLGCAKIARA
jgi:hypothetical protein